MRIAVLGAGAVGLSIAARLSRVADVVAVTRERYAAAIRQEGFHMTGRWGDGVYDLVVSTSLDLDEEFDHVFVTAKSVDTAAVCREFAPVLGRSEVVSLQNGIGNEEIIAEYTDRVIGGMIITGFEWRSTNAVHVSVEGGPMKLGRFPGGMDPGVDALVDLVRKAGIPVEGTASIRTEIWGKTMYNCALNPLGALMNVPYGRLTEPHAWAIIEAIVTEVYAVACAEGVALAWPDPASYLAFLASMQLPSTASHHSSMLQDLARGRPTEIDFLNGAITAIGTRHGVPVPVNACIAHLVRFRESLAGG
ncbi:MAG TPA: ketopantoate reductase family protein [Methanoregulaceae archaeon]|nr:ketopantoate reductase family protein [Methanoregulaceae archaeon]